MLIAGLFVSLLINCIMANLSELVLKVSFEKLKDDSFGVRLDFVEPSFNDCLHTYFVTSDDNLSIDLSVVQSLLDEYFFLKNNDVDDLPF